MRGAMFYMRAGCNQFCHPVQRYAAGQCNAMLPLNAELCCHREYSKYHPRRRRAGCPYIIHAEGVRGALTSSTPKAWKFT